MASVFDNPDAKSKCQIFTPTHIVNQMLDNIDYTNGLYGKRVLDHSCGDGQFLKEVVRRYINDCRKQKISVEQIRHGLSQDIWGFELDKERFDECIQALNVIAKDFGLNSVEWKVFNCDSLRTQIDKQFDYIVGNPPYLSYWDIPKSEREFIKGKYDSCQNGACDYCFAFIEDALALLTENGILTYIIPSSIFKTRAGHIIREKIKPCIRSIYDFRTKKVFDNALTSSAIIVLDKADISGKLIYSDDTTGLTLEIDRATLNGAWIFNADHINQPVGVHRFGDFFKVSSSIATQYNKAFVLINWEDDGTWLKGPNGECIEKSATWKAASPKGQIANQSERIIFPID